MKFKIFIVLTILASSMVCNAQGSKVVSQDKVGGDGEGHPISSPPDNTSSSTQYKDNSQEVIPETEWLEIQPYNGGYDQSPEAAARANANRNHNTQRSNMNNPNEMSYWSNMMSQAFTNAMQNRREEEQRAKREWEAQLKREKADLQRLKDGYEQEVLRRGRIGVGQRNIANHLINGGDISQATPSSINAIFNQEKSEFSIKDTPYYYTAIYDDTPGEYFYMFNYYNSAPKSVADLEFSLKLSAAKDSYLGCTSYSCLSRKFRERGYRTPHVGVSKIVAIPKQDFLKIFPNSSSLSNFISENRLVNSSNGAAIFNRKSDVMDKYHLMISSNYEKIQELHAGLNTIYVQGVEKVDIDAPLASIAKIKQNIQQFRNSRTIKPFYDDDVVDSRNHESYSTVIIGIQRWMAESFKLNGGVFIKKGEDKYFYDATTASQLCPSGWRLPTKNDIYELGTYIERTHGVEFKEENSETIYKILRDNYGFIDDERETGYVQMNFDYITSSTFSSDKEYKRNEKYKEKLRNWYTKKWLDTKDIPSYLQAGKYNTIPNKFLSRLGHGSYDFYWDHTKHKQTGLLWFWLNDLEFKGDEIQKFYVAGIGKDRFGSFYDDDLDVLYPCRCIKVSSAEATKAFEKVNINQATENELNRWGYVFLNLDSFEKAKEIFIKNIEKHPDSANCYDSLGECYMKMGRNEEAIKQFKKGLTKNPTESLREVIVSNLQKLGIQVD